MLWISWSPVQGVEFPTETSPSFRLHRFRSPEECGCIPPSAEDSADRRPPAARGSLPNQQNFSPSPKILVPCFNRKSLKILLLTWFQQCCNYAWKSPVDDRKMKRPYYYNCMKCFIEAITGYIGLSFILASPLYIIYSKSWSPIQCLGVPLTTQIPENNFI